MSDALFKDCPKCGEKVHVSKKVCPGCGHKNKKKLRWFHWVLIVFAGLIALSAVGGGEETTSTAGAEKSATKPAGSKPASKPQLVQPEDQQRFVETVVSFKKDFRDAKNELQQSSARTKRRQGLADLGLGMSVNDWVGTIRNLETTSEGNAAVSIAIGSDIEIQTWNNEISDIGAGTLISQDTALYDALAQLSRGQKVKFSGSFLRSDEDYYEETSLTIDGSMTQPEFLFKFSDVAKID
ncbi:hypothetical protein LJB99_03995 [Deltaproteobacteria bacterium OttesenSCG-928-K17]|nr:hypothetical protein [Deltaproteobacteria bacterium OttesenSCG-928-K17]